LKLSAVKKRIYIYAAFNFLLGAIAGIVLFYGQQKSGDAFNEDIMLKTNIGMLDFVQLSWLNLLWFTAIPVSGLLASWAAAHPIMLARGAVCTFSVCCILKYCGILKAAAAVVPQCVSVLPAMLFLSSENIKKDEDKKGAITRRDFILMVVLSLICAAVEALLYSAFLIICK